MLVSVVMSVYNGEKYLQKAIESILNQTYKEFEFIIIDDGSTDSSLKIIKNYKDSRIILVENKVNKGLIYSLNKGFEIAKGKYIARMDCDDIAEKNRIKIQLDYMEKNSDVAITGTGVKIIFEGLPLISKKSNQNDEWEYLKIKSFFSTPFVHPTVMIRNDILKTKKLKYREEFKYAEDYGLWTDIIREEKCVNIKKNLLKYRIVKQSVTRRANRNLDERREVFIKIYDNYFKKYGIQLTEKELNIHFEICMIQNLRKLQYSVSEKENYVKILNFKLREKGLDKSKIKEVISEVFLKTYLYGNIHLKDMNYEVVKDSGLKKIFLVEKLKQQIKKIYK